MRCNYELGIEIDDKCFKALCGTGSGDVSDKMQWSEPSSFNACPLPHYISGSFEI